MKKLLKVILPPLVVFFIFAVLIKGPFSKHVTGLAEIGDETAYGLMAYYKIFAPLLLVTALLTQILIVLPLWRGVLSGSKARVNSFIIILLICILPAAAISYIIWDRSTGSGHLIGIFVFMAGVQIFYWLINFGILFLIDRREFHAVPEPKQI